MKPIATFLMLAALAFGSGAAIAQNRDADLSMKRLQTALGVLNQELAALYEQIKTLQSVVASNDRSAVNAQSRTPGLSMEQVEAARRKAVARDEDLQAQIDKAFDRIKEIEQQKQPLLRRLQEQLDFENAAP